ncbi:HAD family hydrolase [Mucisphaera calidilacus]|uniref:Haloacid dehalogenase-like hydrolase n=1 Tax=Mucisphaera calidilacus TaxID=2527982 RepID=A0A518BWE3_9BACT|nr:HAD family hydrolase [Mucisphaera calidilacus]QDU71295.1 haloacid dehalogenase-like hydrolase [Mucisphaera calidilacus]
MDTRRLVSLFLLITTLALCACQAQTSRSGSEALPSWTDGPTRDAIIDFVEAVTNTSSPDYVPAADRIAVFDNDGNLWSEQPLYFQLIFAIDRIKEIAPEHPEWRSTEPFASILRDDLPTALAGGEEAILQIVAASHGNLTTDEFRDAVEAWLETARHPTTGAPYTRMVYQPQLELLDYLRAHGFSTWIVSGGGVDFMRPWTEAVYGIPPQQVIGSRMKITFEVKDGKPTLFRHLEIDFIDDKAGKPVGIHQQIGKRPILASGNSDGDLQMLQYTHAGPTRTLCLYLHHTDGEREWVYDRDSHIGRLDQGLDEARINGWTVINMKEDWLTVFPSDE